MNTFPAAIRQVCEERMEARTQPSERLKKAIEHAAHLLPAQGPITVFVHHNTLHAFEDLPFGEAVKRAAKTFGCQPYLTLDRYREELAQGRIRLADLEAVLRANLGALADERVWKSQTRLDLRLAMLQHPLRYGPTEELLWFVAETDALRRVRSDVSEVVRRRLIAETRRWVMRDLRGRREAEANGSPIADGSPRPTKEDDRRARATSVAALLERFEESRLEAWSDEAWESFMLRAMWRVCREGVSGIPEWSLPSLLPLRHRDLLLLATGTDADAWVHELLIRFSGAFLDQGLARWRLPKRELGFYRAFCSLYRQQGSSPERWRRGLAEQLGRLEDEGIQPLDSILESLAILGVEEQEWDEYLSATLLALRGWTGMVHFLEERPDRAVQAVPAGSLIELVAIRLVLDRVAVEFTARETLKFNAPLAELRAELRRLIGPAPSASDKQRAFVVFQLAQVLGISPEELHRLGGEEWANLLEEIDAFSAMERRAIFHLAYEHRFYTQTLDALALHKRQWPTPDQTDAEVTTPSFQAMFCIDEREESMRRHLEELAPEAETFGIAGFYFVDMYYRGAGDAHYVPLCPIVIRPKHWVTEGVDESLAPAHERRAKTRRALGLASHQFHMGSRTFALGALLSAAVGVLATAPLIARTLFPRLTARIRQAMGRMVVVPPATRLQIERSDAAAGASHGQVGFTLEEMVGAAERVLRDTGLTKNFSRLVLTIGHGSTSMNNPHESAYNCGACGGANGGPNARAIAQILNDARVRQRLAMRGLCLPSDTVFVGGVHNTGNETIAFFDLDRLPASHAQEFEAAADLLEKACNRNAHERCRRFLSAPLTLSFAAARQHVEGRAEDLAQARPECGHATNAICIVGRRERTRGLFLDRRAFLNSYDPSQDDEDGTILLRILQAAVPVCAGISLEYYFSYVDNSGYGCGTKLPHNIASLVGVMDGAASDLRTGLPWQMVEIHEPVRILFVIETTPETMQRVMNRNAEIKRLVRNGWVRLATLDPHSSIVHLYRGGDFYRCEPVVEELPRAASSADWYRGWRDHLEFAEIGPAS